MPRRLRGLVVHLATAAVLCLTTSTAVAVEPSTLPTDRGASVRLDVRSLEVAGVSTAYAVLGPVDGLPLLLLNGTGSPMSQWDPALLAGLAHTQRVIVYDYPGLGGSDPLPRQSRDGTITVGGLAWLAAGLLAALRIGKADVLGWSMGGFVAQRLVVHHPDRVRRLILAATNPGGPRTVLGPAWVQAQDSDPDGSLRGYVRTNYPAGARDRGWAFIRRLSDAVAEGRYPADRVPASTYDAMVAAEDPWLASGANLRQLSSTQLQTLVMTGAQDVVTPPANSRLLADSIPNSRLRLVPGAGHSFLFQRPTATAGVIADFLDG